MPEPQEQRCKACGGAAHDIHLIDKAGTLRGDTDLEYSLPEARRDIWRGRYAVAGKVQATLCEACGQITLYGKPEPAK